MVPSPTCADKTVSIYFIITYLPKNYISAAINYSFNNVMNSKPIEFCFFHKIFKKVYGMYVTYLNNFLQMELQKLISQRGQSVEIYQILYSWHTKWQSSNSYSGKKQQKIHMPYQWQCNLLQRLQLQQLQHCIAQHWQGHGQKSKM